MLFYVFFSLYIFLFCQFLNNFGNSEYNIGCGDFNQQQQEQDPTNLYIANLPPTFKETDLETLLAKYGQVVSTRILRDQQGQSKGE